MSIEALQKLIGPCDGFCNVLSGTSVEGWAYDRTAPATPLVMEVLIDGEFLDLVQCDISRDDFTQAAIGRGVGFYIALPENLQDGGDHVIEFRRRDGTPVSLRDESGIHHRWILPKVARADTSEAPSSLVCGVLDPIQEDGACGWAYDTGNPDAPVILDIFIDGVFQSVAVCDIDRVDVKAAGHPTSKVGFRSELPSKYFDGELHVLEVRPQRDDLRRFEISQGDGAAGQVFKFDRYSIISQVDGLHNGAVGGWVYRKDHCDKTTSGGLQVLVTMQGHPIAQIEARGLRPDVAAAHDCDPNCGFIFYPPTRLVAGRTVEFDFRLIPGGHVITGSPVRVNFPSLETTVAILDLYKATEKIYTDLWILRDRLRRMVPAETYSVDNYDPWARQYQRALADAPDRLPELAMGSASSSPLVSIICPVFRPRQKDFVAAVQSVLAQTYANWELIIVDDASGLPELTNQIADFVEQDARVKAVILPKNGGISAATNKAIELAEGDYVALFDHDDLLAERAIEFMVAAALRTGALMLYSDEDKVDDDGIFSEPNFKPDWNYRLLLSINYVCHLLVIDRSQLAKIGPFRSECDGAQDHDIALRLSEVVPHDRIVHVPEVLYHWRKTPASTAMSGKSKTYTVAAGIRAIQDHLDRKRLAGRAYSPRAITSFEIDWEIAREPSITIIIPYREHIAMTRSCLEAIRDNTDYSNYQILLVDNWSISDEALEFSEEIKTWPRVSVMRVQEPFNYSRINNLAVSQSSSDLLLFMNNDVFVSVSD